MRTLTKIVLIQVLFDDAWRLVAENAEVLFEWEESAESRRNDSALAPIVNGQERLRALLEATPKFRRLPSSDVLKLMVAQTNLTA